MKKLFAKLMILIMVLAFFPVVSQKVAAAKFADGTWAQSASPGTTTITFTTTGGLDTADTILIGFPTTATVGGTNITISGAGCTGATGTRTASGQTTTITFTAGTCTGAGVVTLTMTDALSAYTTTTYAQESASIRTLDEGTTHQDYGLVLKTNDNTTDVTGYVALTVNMAVDDVSMTFGTLSSAATASDDQIYTVNSNNSTGVTLQIDGDTNGLVSGSDDINDVSDGAVTTGQEEYGIANVGSGLTLQGIFTTGDDPIPATATTIASSTLPVASATLTVTYKASIGGTTPAGSYSEVVTMTVASNS